MLPFSGAVDFEEGVGGFNAGGEPENPDAPDSDSFSITALEVVTDADVESTGLET